MAVRHSWDFATSPRGVRCAIHPSDATDVIHSQSASDAGSRNSGGTTVAGTTPDRVTNVSIGGANWVRLRTMYGDNYIAGSGARYRCDYYYTSQQTSTGENTISVYRQTLMVRPGVDYTNDGDNFATIGWGMHRNGAGFPGGNMWCSYAGQTTNSGNNAILWGTNGENVASGTFAWQTGGLVLEMYGGPWPTQSQSTTPHYINMEQWQLLAPNTWQGKAVDMAWRVKWGANKSELGEKFYKDYNSGAPTNLASSGWIEIQYRIGTVGASSITWGAWQWYDGGTITFVNGGQQKWVNGPDPHRHYRPTLFFYQDTLASDAPYWKGGHNYRSPANTDSSVYVGANAISDSFTDLGLAEPGASSGGGGGGGSAPTLPALGVGRARFGLTTIPSTLSAAYGDRQRGMKVSVTDNITEIDTAYMVLQSTSSGTQVVKAALYDSTGTSGGPGSLLAVSDEVSLTCPLSATWQQFNFSTPTVAAPGDYWILLFSGNTSALLSYSADTTSGSWANFADTYSDGAASSASGVVLSTQRAAMVIEGDLVLGANRRPIVVGGRTNSARTVDPGKHITSTGGGV